MKLLTPRALIDANIVAGIVPESTYPIWGSSTYALGARVYQAHRVFESTVAGNSSDPAAGDGNWLDIGPTNGWAMFDSAAGNRSLVGGSIVVTVAPGAAVAAIGLVDLQAATARVQVSLGGVPAYDVTLDTAGTGALALLDLPMGAAQQITLTLSPAGGFAALGGLLLGDVTDLGDLETNPTLAITDYSRRETDDFGVTTVAERSWTKKLTARTRLDSAMVDGVRRALVTVRAQPALYIGEDGYEALIEYGFFKDFSVDLQLGSTSFCSLTVEGLPTFDPPAGAIDPAVDGTSTLRVIAPLLVTPAMLAASDVAETDYPAWANGTTYAVGARVIEAHRVYESAVAANVGHDPAAQDGNWLEVGPTTRWAMFDEALGTRTVATGSITVTITPTAPITALGLIDLDAATVRVQAPGYDTTQAVAVAGVAREAVAFLDLAVSAGQTITVTIAAASGSTLTSVGTFTFGELLPLGVTEISPTVTITDYSLKQADDFGNTVPVERAWAKKLTVRSLVSSDAVTALLRRVAAIRARPALWIADDDFDSLALYGFYRDASFELGVNTSTLALTVEGLSEAAQLGQSSAELDQLQRDIAAAQAEIDAIASANVLTHGARKSQLLIDYTALYNDFAALDTRYAAMGSPSDLTSYRNTAASARGALDTLLMSYTPAWNDLAHDTPIDGATLRSTWTAAAQAISNFAAALSGRPPIVTLNASATLLKLNADGSVPGGYPDFVFTATRQNTLGGATWSFTHGQPTTASGITIAGDQLTVTAARMKVMIADNQANGFGPLVGVIVTASGLTASLAVTQVQDGTQGSTGPAGSAGAQGPAGANGTNGANGVTLYTWIAYANAADGSVDFTTSDGTGRSYIGLANNKTSAIEGTNPADYMWSLIKGTDGVPGTPGTNGQPTYTWFAYASSADGSANFTTGAPGAVHTYLGIAANKTTATESTDYHDYYWSKIRGENGTNGSNGLPGTNGTNGANGINGANGLSVHIAYADSADGSVNFTAGDAGGRSYVGVYSDTNAGTDSGDYRDYAWSRWRGADGSNGIPGAVGANGQTTYVHIAYSNASDGSVDFDVSDPAGRAFVGLRTDYVLADSTNPADYSWSLIKGADGTTPLSAALSTYQLSVAADSANATKPGQLPKNVSVAVSQGSTDRTGGSTVGLAASSSAIVASYSAGIISVTQADAAGYIDVTVTYGGTQIGPVMRIAIVRPQDAPPPASATSGSGDFDSIAPDTSYVVVGESIVLKANASGTVYYDLGVNYSVDIPTHGVRTMRLTGTVAWRVPAGSWNYPTGTTGTQATAYSTGDTNDGALGVSGAAITGLTAGNNYEFQPAFYSSSNVTGFLDGSFTVRQS